MEQLCSAYWFPLYAFVRRRGQSRDDAMDLIQGFFTHVVEKDAFAALSPDKGRFRAFLLASLKNFMSKRWRQANAARRGGDVALLSIDRDDFEKQYCETLSDKATADVLYDRCWVETLLSSVLQELEAGYRRADRMEIYHAIQPYLAGGLPRDRVAQDLQMSPAAVGMSLHRMRKRYGDLLRKFVADTVVDPSEVEDELARLMEIVAHR